MYVQILKALNYFWQINEKIMHVFFFCHFWHKRFAKIVLVIQSCMCVCFFSMKYLASVSACNMQSVHCSCVRFTLVCDRDLMHVVSPCCAPLDGPVCPVSTVSVPAPLIFDHFKQNRECLLEINTSYCPGQKICLITEREKLFRWWVKAEKSAQFNQTILRRLAVLLTLSDY